MVADETVKIGATSGLGEKRSFTINLAAITVNLNVYAVLGSKPTDAEKEAFWSLGDVNRDGAIDFVDVSIIRDAFGSTPGDPNWNPDCDLNKDGKIDAYDIAIVSGNYGSVIKEASPVGVDVRITGPGIDQTVKTSTTVTLTSTGTYTLTCGGQTKTFKLLESDDGATYDIIFYLTEMPTAAPTISSLIILAGLLMVAGVIIIGMGIRKK